MKFHEWFEKYQKAQNDLGVYLDSDCADHMEAAFGFARATNSLCPGHGRAECVSCCWPAAAAAEQSAGYTAVDMCTAAADGYRDGKASFEVELPARRSIVADSDLGYNAAIHDCEQAIIAAGGKVK